MGILVLSDGFERENIKHIEEGRTWVALGMK